jgi:hypothetical protein
MVKGHLFDKHFKCLKHVGRTTVGPILGREGRTEGGRGRAEKEGG